MRVLHLPNSYLPWSMGGKEVYTHELSKSLNALGINSDVVVHKYKEGITEGIHKYDGQTINVLPEVKVRNKFVSRFTRELDEAPGFEEFLLANKPNVVHFHDQNDGASLTHLRIVKKHNIKAVLTFHTPGQLCPQRALLFKNKFVCDGRHIVSRCSYCQLKNIGTPELAASVFSKITLANDRNTETRFQKLIRFRSLTVDFFNAFREFCDKVDAVHVLADWAREMYIENDISPDKIFLFRTGGKKSISFSPKEYRNPLKLVMIGRCTPIKGIHVLIDAVMLMDPSLPVEVFFFGPDWQTTEYGREMLSKIGSDPRFNMPVMVPNVQLQAELLKMDVCVIPSIWLETGPITILDAFSVGLPIIGSNLGGIRELLKNDRNGLLFEPGNASDLKDKIMDLLLNAEKISCLRANIVENRTMFDVAQDTMTLYKNIVQLYH